jgi:hypothetical protein
MRCREVIAKKPAKLLAAAILCFAAVLAVAAEIRDGRQDGGAGAQASPLMRPARRTLAR